MNRVFWVFAIFGLCVVGCNKTSNSGNQTINQSSTAGSRVTTATPAGQPTKSTEQAGKKLSAENQGDVSGAYFPAGDLPDDFNEIEHLALSTLDDQGNPAPLNGFLRPKQKSAKDYKLLNLRLNGNEISFSTTMVGKVSYSFKGRFETMGNFPENPPATDRIVLTGELLKMIDGGAPVAGANVSFTYSAGG